MSSFNFKDNLTIDNNKYLKWLNTSGTTRSNIISLTNNNDLYINSGSGDFYINSNNTSSTTFINRNNLSNTIISSKLGVGMTTSSNISADLTIRSTGYIGTNSNSSGYLGISGSQINDTSSGSKIILYANNNGINSGILGIYSGNNTTGNISMYTGSELKRFQITNDGSTLFTPDGVNTVYSITSNQSTYTNTVIIVNTTNSFSASSGALQVMGGIGIVGNLYVDGTLSISTSSGNISFDSSQASLSYTTGAIFITGGLGVSNTVNATSITSGGGISIGGGAAIGKDTYIGGKLEIVDSRVGTSSFNGSLVVYGSVGINNPIYTRSDSASQIKIAPVTNGNESSIAFFSTNNYSVNSTGASSTWSVGQNVGNIGSGNWGIYSINTNTLLTATFTSKIGISNTSPQYKLDVTGDARFTQNTNAVNTLLLGNNNTGGNAYANFSLNNDVSDAVMLLNSSTRTTDGGPNTFTIRNNSGPLRIQSFEDNSSIYISTSGNIGINTTSPSALLNINGNVIISSTLDASGITSGALSLLGGLAVTKSTFIGGPILLLPRGTTANRPTTTRGSIRYNTDTDQFEGFGASDIWGGLGGVSDADNNTTIYAEMSPGNNDNNLRFLTNSVERMRINSSGNIGISTTSPNSTLTVNGTFNVINGSTLPNLFSTNITTTNLNSTNLTTANLNCTSSTITNLFSSNVNNTNITTSNAIITNANITNITFSNGVVTNILNTNLTTTNLNSTNSSTTNLMCTSSTITNLFSTNQNNTNITSSNSFITNATITNSTISNGITTNLTTTNLNSTNISSSNVRVSTFISVSSGSWTSNGNDIFINANNSGIALRTLSGSNFNELENSTTSFTIRDNTGTTSLSLNKSTNQLSLIGNFNMTNLATIPNLFSTNVTCNNLVFTNLLGTNITNTNLISTNISNTNLLSTTVSTTSLNTTTITSGNIYIRSLLPGDLQSWYSSSGSKVLSISSLGNLFINSTANSVGIGSGGSLTILGGGSFNNDLYVGGTVFSSSDFRLKTNIRSFSDNRHVLDTINDIRTVKFNYINYPERDYIGFIAQDFEKHYPQFLSKPPNGFYSLDYSKITVLLLECIKELKRDIDSIRCNSTNK